MCMRCDDGAEYECDRCGMQFCLDHVHQHTPDKCPASFGRVLPWMARRKAMPPHPVRREGALTTEESILDTMAELRAKRGGA